MNKIPEQLSSLRFTTWTLVVLILWFVWGILLAGSETFSRGFALMNSALVWDWLTASDNGSSLLKFWFLGLCLVMVFLGTNLIFCSWNRFFKNIRAGFSCRKLVMLIVHVVFGLVALGHLGSLVLGFRHEKVLLQEGQSFWFTVGYEVMITEVHFVDDHRVLRKSRGKLTRDEFSYHANYAQVVLNHKGRELRRDRVYMLRPMRYKDIQVTLKGFTPSCPDHDLGKGDLTPGVILVITKSPVTGVFLIIYPLMIIAIGIYLVMTWRVPSRSN